MMDDGGGWWAQQQDDGGQQGDGGGWQAQQDDEGQGQEDYGGSDQSYDDGDDAFNLPLKKKPLRGLQLGPLDDGGPEQSEDEGLRIPEVPGIPNQGAGEDQGIPDQTVEYLKRLEKSLKEGGPELLDDKGLLISGYQRPPDQGDDKDQGIPEGGNILKRLEKSLNEGGPEHSDDKGLLISEYQRPPDQSGDGSIPIPVDQGLPDQGADEDQGIPEWKGIPEWLKDVFPVDFPFGDIAREAHRRKFDALEKRLQSDKFMSEAQKHNDKQGYSVDFVRRIESLFGFSHSKESESGKFSKDLVRVLAIYQLKEGLEADGELGDETLKKLRSDSWIWEDQFKGPGEVGREIISRDATPSERYEYYERLVKKRFGVFREGADEINIIGIRGMQYGKQVSNVVGQSNDTIAIVWRDEDGNRHVREFTGSVDPGIVKTPMNPEGVAHIKDGSYVYKLGRHTHGKDFKELRELRDYASALAQGPPLPGNVLPEDIVIFKGDKTYDALRQASAVTVYRDTDRIGQKGHGYIEANEMKEHRGLFKINMHFSGPSNPRSQGCQVIPGAREYVEFIRIIKQGTNTKAIPYTVVDASKL